MNTAPILYVEDDENDAFLLQRAFTQAEVPNPLVVLNDGGPALAYLAGTGEFANRAEHPFPGLVLLDLNMSGKSGFDVLHWMRHNPCCQSVPAIVLTSSHQEGDVARAYAEYANAYLVKPNKPDELLTLVKALRDFWLIHNYAPAPFHPIPASA